MYENQRRRLREYPVVTNAVLEAVYHDTDLPRTRFREQQIPVLLWDTLVDHLEATLMISKGGIRQTIAALQWYGLVAVTFPNGKTKALRPTLLGDWWMHNDVPPELRFDWTDAAANRADVDM